MIEINEEFVVAAPPAETYAVLSDPHAVVECIAGAALGAEHEDGTFDGSMTVKFSALRVQFSGRVGLELHPDSLCGTVTASGRDGQGGTRFKAVASFAVEPQDGGASSKVTATGEVLLSGKLASVIENAATAVVRRMTADFVAALTVRCASGATELGPAHSTGAAPAAGTDAGPSAPGPVSLGVLLLHGFGGTPSNVRAWGDSLAAAGLAVSIPRLPGHGSRWRDLNAVGWPEWLAAAEAALAELRARQDVVLVMGESLGGTLALRLAELHGDRLAGVVVVNPVLTGLRGVSRLRLALRGIAPWRRVPGTGVRKPGVTAVGYQRTPLRAAHSLQAFGAAVRAELPAISAPVLLVSSRTDELVSPADGELLWRALDSRRDRRIVLSSSDHHVALDNDAQQLFAESAEFATARTAVGSP